LALRAKFGLGGDSVVITFVGTFGQWHGVDILARAIRSLVDTSEAWLQQRRVHFLLIGDGLKMSEVKTILSTDRCRRFATLVGLVPQHEAPSYLATSDVLVSPHVKNPDGTRFFGSPTKLFEYMAMGKGIVASDLDQIGEVLQDSLRVGRLPTSAPNGEETALAVLGEPGSVEDLIGGVRFLVEQDLWREALGRNARREALTKYTWAHHVDAIVRGLERTCAPR
jgi:glycosyltransferase involved in cell wall biosynthesis